MRVFIPICIVILCGTYAVWGSPFPPAPYSLVCPFSFDIACSFLFFNLPTIEFELDTKLCYNNITQISIDPLDGLSFFSCDPLLIIKKDMPFTYSVSFQSCKSVYEVASSFCTSTSVDCGHSDPLIIFGQ